MGQTIVSPGTHLYRYSSLFLVTSDANVTYYDGYMKSCHTFSLDLDESIPVDRFNYNRRSLGSLIVLLETVLILLRAEK